MVKLRLKRMGKKRKPIYRIVAADARSPRDGRFIEDVGFYDPNKEPMEVRIKEKRVVYWINSGAKPTETVMSLLRRLGLLHKLRLKKRGFSEEAITEEMNKYFDKKKDQLEREKERKLRRRQNKTKKSKEEKKEGA